MQTLQGQLCWTIVTFFHEYQHARHISYLSTLPTSVVYEVFQHFWQFRFCVAQSFTECFNNHYSSALRVIIFSGQLLKLIQDHMNLALIKEISHYNSVAGSLYCHCKGQLISKCLLGVTILTKKPTKSFLIWPLFRGYGSNSLKKSLVFWSKWWHQKDNLKLTDLYPKWQLYLQFFQKTA